VSRKAQPPSDRQFQTAHAVKGLRLADKRDKKRVAASSFWNGEWREPVSRKAKKPDEWDPPIAAYDPYGPGTGVAGDDDFVAGDASA
jgi:hypothetical protein